MCPNLKEEISIMGDGDYSRVILVAVPFKDVGGRGTWTLCLA